MPFRDFFSHFRLTGLRKNARKKICYFGEIWLSAKIESERSASRKRRTALENERDGRYARPEEGRRVEKEGGGGRRKRSDNPSKLTPTSAPGEMQIWSICHVCLGILILVRGWGFSLAALWLLSDPPAFLSRQSFLPSEVDDSPDRPRWAENCLRIGCRSGFRDPATFSSFILPFPPFLRGRKSTRTRERYA